MKHICSLFGLHATTYSVCAAPKKRSASFVPFVFVKLAFSERLTAPYSLCSVPRHQGHTQATPPAVILTLFSSCLLLPGSSRNTGCQLQRDTTRNFADANVFISLALQQSKSAILMPAEHTSTSMVHDEILASPEATQWRRSDTRSV